MRSFGLIFGNTTDAVAMVLAVFMGGLALGSALVARRRSLDPLRAYAFLNTGTCFYEAGRYGQCFKIMRQVIENFPASPQSPASYSRMARRVCSLTMSARSSAASCLQARP